MLWELYTAALGMLPQQTKLAIIANNIANVETSGYKRIGTFLHTLIEAQQNLRNVPGQAEPEDTFLQRYIDFSAGRSIQTGNPLDVLIDGDGFFVLGDEDGNVFLTRSGRFVIGPDGYLRTRDGKYVMGSAGPILLQTETPLAAGEEQIDQIRITQNGEIYRGQRYIDRLHIVQIQDSQSLQMAGTSQFVPTDQTLMESLSPSEIRIRQGYIEGSNVTLVDEIVQLISLQRSFELGQRVMRTNDATLGRSITIGRFF